MKALKALAVFFGILLTWSLASEVSDVSSPKNADSYTYQTVKVNQQDQLVSIHNYNTWNGWDAIWDYRKGFFATRLFRKRACIVATMNLKTFPEPETLSTFKGQQHGKSLPLAHDSRFSIGKTHVKNIAQCGDAIEQLCKGIPTYFAYQEQGTNLPAMSSGCTNVGVRHFFSIYLCGIISNC